MAQSDGHSPASPDEILHASAVAVDGRAVLITGASGSGKSTLALQLIAVGADLISDDRTALVRDGARIIAAAAPNIAGLIEARGIGLLRADAAPPAPVALVVDLDTVETERLPPWRTVPVLGLDLPCVHKAEGPHFPAAILQYLRYGRAE